MSVPVSSQLEPIPGYKLIDRLGRGGFGEVWRVEAPGGLHKAMKFVFGDLNDIDDDNIRAAEQELKALDRVKNIRHPFILSLEQWKIINGQLIIVMELAERNLWDRFKECRGLGMPGIPREELLNYLIEAAEALDLMNTKYSIQHLDVKPQNLFLMYNHVKVADFGLAKAFEGGRGTVTGGVTPVYAGPETFEGYVSRYTDQYSLAIVFQELLTGTRPFNGSNTKQLVMQHLNGTPDLDHLPAYDRSIIARALSKKPEDRWPSCMELVRSLRTSAQLSGSGGLSKDATTAARTPQRTLSPTSQQLVGGELSQVGPTLSPTQKGQTKNEELNRAKSNQSESPTSANGRRPALNPGVGATGNTPYPLKTPRLVTPQGAAGHQTVGQSPQAAPGSNQRPIVAVPTAKMSDLGVVGPAREGDGILMPALIVGAGESGLCTIRALKRIFREQFGAEPLPHVRFLYIDTDPDAITSATDTNKPDPLTSQEVLLTRLNRAAHYLQRDGIPSAETWMPKGILYKLSRNPGPANGVRAYGRLALTDHYKSLTHRLRTELNTFLTDTAIDSAATRTGLGLRSNRARVYVIANTCGGTGSGMLLDLAYIIKNEFRQIGHSRPEVVGHLLVPTADKTGVKGLPLANTYATLQELLSFQSGRTSYQARFLNNESVSDKDGPFTRCNLVQLDKNIGRVELAYAAGLVARTIYVELFSPTGRVLDSVRSEALLLNKSGQPTVQAIGMYRLSWPRQELLEIATRQFCQRLIQQWTAKESTHLREPIQRWLDTQWQNRNLELEYVVDQYNQAVKQSLHQDPDRVFEAFVTPLRQRSANGRLDLESAYDVLEQLVKVVGTPESDPENPGSLQLVLAERHKRMVTEVEGHLSAMAVAFIEQPQYRLGGAEEVLQLMIERLKRTVSGLEGVRSGIMDEVNAAYTHLAQVLTREGHGLGLPMIGPRKALVTAEFLNTLEDYPNKRLRLHILDTTLSIYRRLLGSVPEFVREIGFCRQRLNEFIEMIQTKDPPSPFLTGPGRMILPHGVEGITGAADHFLGSLPPQDILDFETNHQKDIALKFRSLVSVCVSNQHSTAFLQLMKTQSRLFLDSRIGRMDAASIFFRRRNETATNTPKLLMSSFEEAAPDLTSISGKPQMEATILALPPGPEGERFRQLVDTVLSGVGFIPAANPDDILFIREYPLLPLVELPQMATLSREAYDLQMANDTNPHTRSDLPWIVSDP